MQILRKLFFGTGLLLWSVPPPTQAQTYQQVAPDQPPAKANGRIVTKLPEAEKARRSAKNDAVFVSKLKGVFFVSRANEVRLGGVSSRQSIEPGDVAFARQGDFPPVVQPFLGQPVTLNSLDKLTSAVVQYYRDHDRPIVNVFAPQQNITNGFVQLVVVEGHVGDIQAKGAVWFSNDDLRKELRLHPGDPISGQLLRNDLEWVNRNPFHQSDIVFGPGDAPGLTDITIKTKDRFPVRFFAGFDDAGNQFTGDNRYFAGFNYGDLFGLGQQLSYQFSTAEDTNQFTAHSGAWVVPLPWHHILTVFGSYGQSSANVPSTDGMFHSSGTSWQTSFRYEVPLRGPTNLTHSLVAGFDFKESNNSLAFGGVPVFDPGADTADTAQFVLGYQATYNDHYGSTSGSIMGFLSPGGITSADSTAAYESQRFGAKPYYAYGQATLQRVTKLPWDFTWTERGLVQFSNRNLLPSEQIGLGGFDTVRGYDEREANGDSGFLVSSELATPPISLGNLVGIAGATDQFQLLGFVDYGGTSLHNPGPNDTNPNTNLLSVGPGIRYAITPYMSFRFDYGFQLMRTGFDSRYDSRGHIGLVMSLPGGEDERTPPPKPLVGDPKDMKDIPGLFEAAYNDNGTGFNLNIYGGINALQDSSATLTSDAPISPNSLTADQQSDIGGVGGLQAGYTFKDFTDSFPLIMPAVDLDFFWDGYQYKTESTTPAFSGSSLTSNADMYSLMLEPKIKFNLGDFRPYLGFGVGGTYIHAEDSSAQLTSQVAGHFSENFPKPLDTGAFSVEGLAGLEYFFDPHWAVNAGYKYLYTDAQGTVRSSFPVGGTQVHLKYNIDGLSTNLFTLGLAYYF
jgi:hemolysin activation/secretion protein/opacity protein-like surface antigen